MIFLTDKYEIDQKMLDALSNCDCSCDNPASCLSCFSFHCFDCEFCFCDCKSLLDN